jgi:hypothetical protein
MLWLCIRDWKIVPNRYLTPPAFLCASKVEALFPSGTSLTLAQLRKVVRALLESRAGEAPPSGREMRALVALLDVNNNGVVSREEFEGGLKECRWVGAVVVCIGKVSS